MNPPKDPDASRARSRHPRFLRGQGRHLLNAGYLSFFVFGMGALALPGWVREADVWIWLPAAVPVTLVVVGALVQGRDKRHG